MDLVYGLQLVFVNKISPEYGHICLPIASGCFHARVAKTLWSTMPRTLTTCACKKTSADLWNQGYKKNQKGTSLVVQWLRICLPMQGTWVQSLLGELRSHMFHRATIPVCHNQRSCMLQQQQKDSTCCCKRVCGTTKTQCSQINKC